LTATDLTTARARASWRHQLFLLRRAARSARDLRRLDGATLSDLFPGVDELEVSMRHTFRPRGLPHGDAYVLALITAQVQPGRIFEIGTGTGEGTLLMARNAPGARIDTLDLGAQADASLGEQRGDAPLGADAVGSAFRGTEFEDSITQHLGDSAAFDFSPFAGQMDLVFVDGAHTAEYVRSDSLAAFEMLAPGGTVVWDDCHLYHPGVSRGLAELRRAGRPITRIETSRFAALRT
jgi:predicted O-methyltransferase YrrM